MKFKKNLEYIYNKARTHFIKNFQKKQRPVAHQFVGQKSESLIVEARAGIVQPFWRRERDSNPRIAVLQTAALPLRHRAVKRAGLQILAFPGNSLISFIIV